MMWITFFLYFVTHRLTISCDVFQQTLEIIFYLKISLHTKRKTSKGEIKQKIIHLYQSPVRAGMKTISQMGMILDGMFAY